MIATPSTRLVNAHTHLELSWAAALCPFPPGQPFADWYRQLVETWRRARDSAQAERAWEAAIEQGIAALLAAGVTHVGDISATGRSIAPLLASGLGGVVYLEIAGASFDEAQASFARARRLLDTHRGQERNGLRLGLSPHAPYSVHPGVLAEVAAFCRREDLPVCIHVAESPAEVQALTTGAGPLVEALGALEEWATPTLALSPIAYLEALGFLAARPLLVHMVQVSDEDLDRVAASGARVVHCPRSNLLLRCGRMPLEKMLARGIPVGLGTDSLASSPSLDVREEAAAAGLLHESFVAPDQVSALLHDTTLFD